ncbi:MAG: DNA polymerase Y family protein [Planctomycetaceae bacterium]|nr:DNA polymerase Y family protein [Planctomycetaceae bacterium]
MLCLRFPNWPIQHLRHRLPTDASSAVVLHTAPPAAGSPQQTVRRKQGELHSIEADLKFIRKLFPSAVGGPTVIGVSPDAWLQGIRPGLPLAEARSMARPLTTSSRQSRHQRPSTRKQAVPPPVSFHEWSPAADRSKLIEVAELTRSFAPAIGLDTLPVPDCLLLNITGCAPLFGSETALAEQLLKRMQTSGWTVRITIADTVAAAWAFAHADGHWTDLKQQTVHSAAGHSLRRTNPELHLPILILPPGMHTDYLAPLALTAARLMPEDTEILRQLGILTIAQLLRLPAPDLPSRLSADAILRTNQIRGTVEETIDPLPEADPVTAHWSSEFPAENNAEVQQVLNHLIEQIVAELIRRRTGCTRLVATLTCEGGLERTISADVIRPSQSTQLFQEVTGLRLEAAPFPESVSKVVMRAVTMPMPVARQRDLFSTTSHISPTEELTTLLDRLAGRLGRDGIRTIHARNDPRPEFSFGSTPIHTADNPDSGTAQTEQTVHALVTPTDGSPRDVLSLFRPVRLLPVPFLIHQGRSQDLLSRGFQWQSQLYAIEQLVGPERIQTAWWQEEPVHRDYFRAHTVHGSVFWIFRNLQSQQWYVHGIFD